MADTIAYCLREAMKAIPESQATGGGGQWRTTSREVVKAKDRLQEAINAVGCQTQPNPSDLRIKLPQERTRAASGQR